MSYVLDAFEVVAAPGGRLLARVAGRWEEGAPPVTALVVDAGRTVHRAALLPAPPATPPEWRGGFVLPQETIAPRAAYALELEDGTLVDLPTPRVRTPPKRAPQPVAATDLEEQLVAERGRVEDLKQRMG